jgi:DNA-binding protein YbaB
MSTTGGYGERGLDLGAVGDALSRVADHLRRTGDQVRQAIDGAATQRFEATSPDGLVRVSVTGEGRVTSVVLSPHVLRRDPDALDGVLTEVLNAALRQARTGAREALLEALPRQARAGIEQAVSEARREA